MPLSAAISVLPVDVPKSPSSPQGRKDIQKNPNGSNTDSENPKPGKTQFTGQGYSTYHAEFKLKYRNSDGDILELNARHKATSVRKTEEEKLFQSGKTEEARNWVREVEKEIQGEQLKLLNMLFGYKKDKEESFPSVPDLAGILGIETSTDEPVVPEYWNAENTSQRIVDFALSFAGRFSGNKAENDAMITAAVRKGFEEARSIFGELPGAAGELWKETEELTFQKLEERLKNQAPTPTQEA